MTRTLAVGATAVREFLRGGGFVLYLLAVVATGFAAPRLTGGEDASARLGLAAIYGLGVSALIAGVFTLAAGAGSLARDLSGRHIVLVDTKPVRRWELLAGKLLAVLALDVVLLAAAFAVFAANVWLEEAKGRPEEAMAAPGVGAERTAGRFFALRAGVFADPPLVVESELEARVGELRRGESVLPGELLRARARRQLETLVVPPAGEVELRFGPLPAGARSSATLAVRCRLHLSPPLEAASVRVLWRTDGAPGAAAERVVDAEPGVLAEVDLGGAVPLRDGALHVRLRSLAEPDSGISILVPPRSVEVVWRDSGLWPNLLRAGLVTGGQLTLLAAVAIFAAALWSLPTASLVCCFVFLTAISSSYIRDSLSELFSDGGAGEALAHVMYWLASRVLDVLADFGAEDPYALLASGRVVSWSLVGRSLALNVGLRAAVFLVAAAWFWRRRELGGVAEG